MLFPWSHRLTYATGLISLDSNQRDVINTLQDLIPRLIDSGFSLIATTGTAKTIKHLGFNCEIINKVTEGRPHIVDELVNKKVDIVINTTEGRQSIEDSASIRKTALQNKIFCTTTIFGAFAFVEASESNALKNALVNGDMNQIKNVLSSFNQSITKLLK